MQQRKCLLLFAKKFKVMIQTIADFYKMTNCEKLGLISGIIENLLKEFSENERN